MFYLFTTSHRKETKDLTPLLLGNWCLKNSINENENRIIGHRWVKFDKYKSDLIYLDNLHDKLLNILTIEFNKLNHVNYTFDNYRVLLSPWLKTLIMVLFERFTSIEKSFNQYKIENCLLVDNKNTSLKTDDLEEFYDSINNQNWNLGLYSSIIRFLFPNNNFDVISIKNKGGQKKTNKKILKQEVKDYIFSLHNKLFGFLNKRNKFLFINTYLSNTNYIKLSFKFKLFPVYFKFNKPLKEGLSIINSDLLNTFGASSPFENYLKGHFDSFVPYCFLEGFNSNIKHLKSLNLPDNPKVIFTSSMMYNNTTLMFYLFDKLSRNSKLIVGQHGANYWTFDKFFNETHELLISNAVISWGEFKNHEKIYPLGVLKKLSKINKKSHAKEIHLVMNSLPRFISNISYPTHQVNFFKYLTKLYNFYNQVLKYEIFKDNLRVRLFPHDYGWNEKIIIEKKFKLRTINPIKNIYSSSREARIVVFTYNSTGILEFSAINSPFLAFIDLEIEPLKKESIEAFEEYHNVGIIHYNLKSLSTHLNSIYNDVDFWWGSNKVQDAITNFSYNFSKPNSKIVNQISDLVKSL